MILQDSAIFREIEEGELGIEPFEKSQIEPSSYDMRLGEEIKTFEQPKSEVIYPDKDVVQGDKMKSHDISDGYIMQPDEFVLATTREYVEIPDYLSAVVYGRSSFGRIGIEVHRAGWVDAGFEGCITLEIENEAPCQVYLEPDMRICQLVFQRMEGYATNPYRGDYQGQEGVTESKYQ